MSAAAGAARAGRTEYGTQVPWIDVLLSAIAVVSWAVAGMAGTAALGLHLLGADTAGSLGPMAAAVVALGAGGAVRPSGYVSAFGLTGAEAHTAIEITPLGVGLVGALLLSWFFLRSLRTAGVVVAPAELLARVGAVLVLFTALMGVLAWAGHDVVTIDGGALGLDRLPGAGGGGAGGGGGGGGGLEIPGLGGLGDLGGLLPDRLGDPADAKAAVGFTVEAVPTPLGGLGRAAGVLLIALLASRRTPLPRGWEAVHRVVRPAASALVSVLLLAVAAGLAAAAYAAAGDDHPRRIAGAALLGAPNGAWLGVTLGLFVPWDGRASGILTHVLPHPLDDLLGSGTDRPVTLARLAGLDGRVWLLAVGAALLMLLAGVLTAVRAPVPPGGPAAHAGRCAVALACVTGPAAALLGWLAGVSVNASLSVLGFDTFGAGIALRERLGTAVLLGALWGAGAGTAGALLARWCGVAGRRAGVWGAPGAPAAPGGGAAGACGGAESPRPYGRDEAGWEGRGPGPYRRGARPESHQAGEASGPGGRGARPESHQAGEASGPGGRGEPAAYSGTEGAQPYALPGSGEGDGAAGASGPYRPRASYRPPNPDTNPYLRVPRDEPEPEDTRPRREPGDAPPDVSGAPTMAGPPAPPPKGRRGKRPPSWPDEVPPPPPPPPAPPPRRPKGPR